MRGVPWTPEENWQKDLEFARKRGLSAQDSEDYSAFCHERRAAGRKTTRRFLLFDFWRATRGDRRRACHHLEEAFQTPNARPKNPISGRPRAKRPPNPPRKRSSRSATTSFYVPPELNQAMRDAADALGVNIGEAWRLAGELLLACQSFVRLKIPPPL